MKRRRKKPALTAAAATKLYRVTKATSALTIYDVEAEHEADAIRAAASATGTLVGTSDLWSAVQVGTPSTPVLGLGFGTYFRRLTASQSAADAAVARCRSAGMAWVSFMVEATDGYVSPLATIEMYVSTFRQAGIRSALWTLPGTARAASVEKSKAAARLLTDYAKSLSIETLMLDVEAAYKSHGASLNALIDETLATAPSGSNVGAVSYPIPSYHPTLDWTAFKKCSWGSPMFYETAQDPALVKKGTDEWHALLSTLVPSLDGWTGTGAAGAARFQQDIINVCGSPPTATAPGAAIWSEQQMDDAKRAVTHEMAPKYGWPT